MNARDALFCDSCGSEVREKFSFYKEGERYDHGYAHGIGECCRRRFEKAGYVEIERDRRNG